MKTYQASRPFQLHEGTIAGKKNQFDTRKGCLEKARVGFKIVKPIWVKANEVFHYDGEIAKALYNHVTEIDESEIEDDANDNPDNPDNTENSGDNNDEGDGEGDNEQANEGGEGKPLGEGGD